MRSLLVLPLCLLLAAPVLADTVVMKDGGKIVGKVTVTRTDVVVDIRPGMRVAFPKEQVKQIIFEDTPREVFQQKFAALGDKDAPGFYSLGMWAKNKGLKEEAKLCFEKVIGIEPDHTAARKELGYVRHEGKWLPYDEAMKAKGLIEYDGRWVTPEQKEKLEKRDKIEALKKQVKRLLNRLASTDKKVVDKAVEEYMKIRDPLAVPALDEGAKHRKGFIRFLTVNLYAEFAPELVTDSLVSRAVADSDERIRTKAVEVLRKIKSKTAYIGVLKNFYYNPNGDVRLWAMEALGALKDKNSIEPLIESVAYNVRRVVTIPDSTPDTFIGTQARKVIGVRRMADAFGRVVEVPIIGDVTSGFGGGAKQAVVDDVIFNLGARLALRAITDQDHNYDKNAWRKWWKENKDKYGPFMEKKKKDDDDE